MTTTTTPPRPSTLPVAGSWPTPAQVGDLGFRGILRGEWIKLLSLRSTWWTLTTTVVVMGLLALAVAYTVDDYVGHAASVGLEPHGAELLISGFQFGMVTISVLGALLMTGEYSTGMVRSTFAAVPTRLPVPWAKALALVVVTVAVALVALGLGAVLKHTAGTITAVLGLLLLLPGVLQFVTLDWVQDLVNLMPLPAAFAFVGTSGLQGANDLLDPWQGVAVVGAYVLVALVGGALTLRRHDA